MNILITDGENSIGQYLKEYFSLDNEVCTFSENQLNLLDKAATEQLITSVHPDVVIHTSELSNIDVCERDESTAYKINTIGSLNVAYSCNILDIPIVYISTSYVYGGEKESSYYETDDCHPVNIYGKTKLAAEKLIATICSKYFILRIPWVFGTSDCIVEKILSNKKVPIFMCSTEIGNPTFIEDIADCIKKIITTDIYGTYNCSTDNPISKSLWVKTILKYANIDTPIFEIPENFLTNTAHRPKYISLNTSLIKNCFDLQLTPWEVRLKEYVNDII